jgi:hypothetical protein
MAIIGYRMKTLIKILKGEIVSETIDPSLLFGQWFHSREEDTPTEIVYRPAGFPLPPSRGRAGLEFQPDGTFKRIGIGRTDISNVTAGSWEIGASNADQVRIEVNGQPETIRIQELEEDRMSIKRNS